MAPKHIVVIGYPNVAALDLVGPLEAFSSARLQSSKAWKPCYRVTIAALGPRSFSSESGLQLRTACSLDSVRHVDTVIVPGGRGLREPAINRLCAAWIGKHAGSIRRIASVCTGIYGLAPTRLLDGRRVTTHWRFCADVAKRFPHLSVDSDSLYVRDGKFYTSAGVTAGIDLSLALIEEDCGPQTALAVARELVMFMKRPGGQEQYSEPLRFQAQATSRFSELASWLLVHLDRDLSVETLAERACLCPRHFSRRFKDEFGTTPAAFVKRLRLDEARRRLSATQGTVESVAHSVGFGDADSFRRAFERRFRASPSEYRQRFARKIPVAGRDLAAG